jgi:uncharacterized protein with HEPN domain
VASDTPFERLRDIVEHIDKIEAFIAGMSRADYENDERTRYAVERCLLIVAEAAAKLADEAEILVPGMPWPDIRGMGNQIRHGYDRLNAAIIWTTIDGDLTPLRKACAAALKKARR